MTDLTRPVSVRLTEGQVQRIDELAEAAGVSRAQWMESKLLSDEVVPVEFGPVGTQTRRDIASLVTLHPMGEALSAIAVNLADALDSRPGMQRSNIAKQLMETLIELSRPDLMEGGDDDDIDLSSPSMGDSEDDE